MSSFVYDEIYDIRSSSKVKTARIVSKRTTVPGLRKTLVLVGVSILCVTAVLCIIYFAILPSLKLSRIKVQLPTDQRLEVSDSTLVRLSGLNVGMSFVQIDEKIVQERLQNQAFIKSVSVHKRFPDCIIVKVIQRQPLCMAVYLSDGYAVPLVFDDEGVLFRLGGAVKTFDVPVISGINFATVQPGIRLPDYLLPFLKQLYDVKVSDRDLYDLISEVKFIKKSNDNFEVMLYTREYRIPVRMGRNINRDMLNSIILVLDALAKSGNTGGIKELDFRSDNISYTIGGE